MSLLFTLVLSAQTQTLERGKEHFRAGRYVDAIEDLRTAAAAALTPEARQAYVATGKIETLAELEESLVYLALTYDRIGREAEARDAVTRLLNAERIAPTYAKLPLSSEAAPFEALAARLVPSIPLVPNQKLAAARGAAPAGIVVQPTLAQQRADMVKLIDERVAAARAEIEKSANARIAEERAAAEKMADERVAAETAAAMKAAEQRIASERDAARTAAMKSADERIAVARAEVEKAAEEKIARERAAMQRESEERIAIERASAEKAAQERIAGVETERRRALLLSLRQAETFAIAGQLEDANRIYTALAQSPTSTREAIAAAAAGLYRTGGFAEAVRAFTRLGKFAPGEDDLRYYYAVSLYEIGKYEEAKTELAAALPNLQRTEDVERYRAKIEQSVIGE